MNKHPHLKVTRKSASIAGAATVLAAGGLVAAIGVSADGEPSVGTATFTNVVTYTVPTVTQTTTVTVTETVAATTPPPTTTAPSPPTTTSEPPPEPTASVNPGQSWDAAFKAASSGDVILVRAGSHGVQTFTNDTSKTRYVTFRGEPGAVVTDLNFKGNHVAVQDVEVAERWYAYPGAKNVLVENVDSERFYIRCAVNLTVRGGTYSDPQATGVPTISSSGGQTIPTYARADCPDDAAPSRNIVLDGVTFERIWRPQGDTSSHRECLHVMGVIGLTVTGGVFRECLGNTAAVSFNIHFSSRIEGVVFDGGTIERTYGGGAYPQPSGTGPSVNISDRAPGYEITFRNYRFRDGTALVPQGAPTSPGAIRFENSTFAGSKPSGLRAGDYVFVNNTYNTGG